MCLVQLLFKKKSLAEHAPQATSKIIEAFLDKASVGLPSLAIWGVIFHSWPKLASRCVSSSWF
jgi:hypothetical protein